MRKAKRGSGGVAVPGRKELSSSKGIADAGIPAELTLFLSQHIGGPSVPVVKARDTVKRGQQIASASGAMSASLHAPTSGTVKAIEERYQPVQGRMMTAIVIVPDGEGTLHESVVPSGRDLDALDRAAIIDIVKDAGLVGMGGAAFPAAVKIQPPPNKPIDTYLLNGAECEPYLSADNRLMVEFPHDVVFGFRALMKGAGVEKGIICIEDNKPEAIDAMEKAASPYPELEIAVLPSIYPGGGEKRLIEMVLDREVPPPPGLPLDVGVIVSNVGTAHALGVRLAEGLPLIQRVVTVSGGAIPQPGNFLTLMGTPISYLIEKAGGLGEDAAKVILGGPMMGLSVHDLDVPVMKGTSGVTVLSREEADRGIVEPCVRCGKCVEACPMRLLPLWIASYAENGLMDEAEGFRAMDCCECGACAYSCPSRRPLVQSIRLAKAHIQKKRRAQAR